MIKTYITLVIFVLFSSLNMTKSQLVIQDDGYAGCYVKDITFHEFNSFVSHLDWNELTPNECRKNCQYLGYNLAAIENGTMCFCKTGFGIVSTKGIDSDCQALSCPGNPNLACGSSNNLMVYVSAVPTQIQNALILNAPTDLPIFSPVTIQVNFTGTPSYLAIMNSITNGITSNVVNVLYHLINNGQKPLSLVYDTSAKFLTPPYSYEIFDKNATLVCPTYIDSTYGLKCDVKFERGTNIKLEPSFGTAQLDPFNPYNFEMASFGPAVSQYLSNTSSLGTSGTYLIVNSETDVDGYLTAIELYASDAGSINVDIKRVCASGQSASFQNPKTCTNSSEKSIFNCGAGSFSTITKSCSGDINSKYNAFTAPYPSFTTLKSFSLTLEAGYNIFTESAFGKIFMESGSYLAITQTAGSGQVALVNDITNSAYDMQDTGTSLTFINKRFCIRTFVSFQKQMGIFNLYTAPGKYQVGLTISSNSNLTNNQVLSSQNVDVIDPLTNLQIATSTCMKNKVCTLTASYSKGSDYTLQWTIYTNPPETFVIQNEATLAYTFKEGSQVQIDLTGWNLVTFPNQTATRSVQIIDQLIDLNLHAGNSNQSSSVVGQSADFLFTLQNGGGYTCTIDFGDGLQTIFTDLPNLNNTFISHIYPSIEAIYQVKIFCINSVGNLTKGPFPHYVQYELTNLRLLSSGTVANKQYYIEVLTDTGSNPHSTQLLIDSVPDNGFTFLSKTGKSSLRTGETTSKVIIVNVTLSNYVSTAKLNTIFEISSVIVNPSFTISPSGDIDASLNRYAYGLSGRTINFQFNADSGANIKVELFTGEELVSNIPTISFLVVGEPTMLPSFNTNPVYNQYTYSNPGDFTIRVRFSNAFGSFTLNKTISIISSVNGLQLGLLSNPVSFSMAFSVGVAQFVFNGGINKAGSHSYVTFWPGDSSDSTSFGPFLLNMDYTLDISKTPLVYNYLSEGNYTATFLIQNILGQTANYKINFLVISGLYGFYIDVLPKIAGPNSAIKIDAYVIRGANVVYEWYVNKVLKYTANRTASLYNVADSYTGFTPSSSGKYEIEVRAKDYYNFVASQIYILEVHEPVTQANLDFYVESKLYSTNSIIYKTNDGNALSRTFNFEIKPKGGAMTDPYYIVDYGDGSIIGIEKPLGIGAKFTYTYKTSGSFLVTITVFNLVSKYSQQINIELISSFNNFECLPYYKLYNDPTTADYLYKPDSTNFYKLALQKPFRFYCTWSGMGSEPNKLYFYNSSASPSFTLNSIEIASLSKIEQDSIKLGSTTISTIFKGLILPIDLTTYTGYNGVFRIKIETGETGKEVISAESSLNVTVLSSISGLSAVPITSIVSTKSQQLHEINFSSLGEPSCVSIQYTSSAAKYNLGSFGTNQNLCKAYFPTLSYKGVYNISFNKFYFSNLISQVGNYRFDLNFTNDLGSSLVNYNVTIADTNINCNNPTIDIDGKSPFFYKPTKYLRTELFTLVSSTTLNCELTLANKKEWLIYLVNSSDGSILSQVNLATNPTTAFAELVIQPNSLNFGLYKFVYRVTMLDGVYNNLYSSEVATFIRIKPAGIIVSSLANSVGGGTLETNLGLSQSLVLNPVSYSYDLDGIVKASSLKFKFYCQVIEKGIEKGYAKLGYNTNIDLYTFKYDNKNLPIAMSNNFTCFDSSSQYDINSTVPNMLTIKAGSLKYSADRIYEILVSTTYLDEEYNQYIRIGIQNVNLVPLVSLKCKFASTCVAYGDSVTINPNTQLIVTGVCLNGTCDNVNSIKYQYYLSKLWKFPTGDIQEKWYPYPVNNTDVTNADSLDLLIYSSLFTKNAETDIWKVILLTTTVSQSNGIATGLSSLIVRVNKIPTGGSCTVWPLSGKAAKSNFTVNCTGWSDPDSDGFIVKYAYYAIFKGDDMNVGLGFNSNGMLSTQLPLGSIYDSYKLSIYVQIFDNDNGIAYYTIPTQVTVEADVAATQSVFAAITSSNTNSPVLASLYSGSSQASIQNILSLSSVLNSMSLSDKVSISSSESSSFTLSQPFNPSGASSAINPPASPISDTQFEENRNNRAAVRDVLIDFINNISISDVNSIRAQASMLTTVTGQTDEITRNSASAVADQCVKMTNALSAFSSKTSVEDIKQVAAGITSAISNVQLGLSNSLNGRQPSLSTDYKNAIKPPAIYDTDIENYDTNPNNFMNDDGSIPTNEQFNKNKNTKEQKSQVADSTQKANGIINTISNVLVKHFPVGETFSINTPSVSMKVAKIKANELTSTLSIGSNTKLTLPSLCDMLNDVSTTTTVRTPLGPLYDPNSENTCSKRTISFKSIALPMAASGKNGNNETNIGLSSTVSLSFFDSNGNTLPITNSKKPIDIWIPRDGTFKNDTFNFVNATGLKLPNGFKLMPSALTIKSNNASIHLNIRKISPNIIVGYLILVKFGDTPFVNSTVSKYDDWKLLCPSDYQVSTRTNESYFLYFMNTSRVNNFKGALGFGIRELTPDDIKTYCINNKSLSSPNEIINSNPNTSFTYDFYLRTFTSGCYYYNTKSSKWSSYGMEIQSDTDLTMAHCQTNHLTDFAGGLIVTPPSINFEYVWANASFMQNPTLYSTVIAITCLYIIVALIAHYVDKRDVKRLSIDLLKDNSRLDNYFYEVMVFTGTRREAGTDSKVRMILSGNYGETEARLLAGEKNQPKFRRGGIDSFLMAVKGPLGNLNYLRIWHDNSGKGKMASWYLKYIIVHDLQTREKFYFLCMDWLAVEKSDGLIDRVLPCAGDKQKVEIKFLMEKQAKQNMSDGHLWFSVLARPALSSFTRMDRVTCCFVLLYISMLVNILYYGVDTGASTGGLKIGPFLLTAQQIGIGIMSNLITFPPSFLLIQLFRRSRRKETRSKKIKDAINKKQEVEPEEEDDFTSLERAKTPNVNGSTEKTIKTKNKDKGNNLLQSVKNDKIFVRVNKKLSFPWWFKIIAYILSYLFMSISLIFIIFRGITFGDEKVTKWITSLMVSFLTSLFFTQPLQVVLIAFFFVLVFRKYDDDKDFEDDHEDDGKSSLNDNYKYYEFKNKTSFIENFRSDDNMYLNDAELKEARERRKLEMQSYDTLREIIIYSIFLSLLIAFTYTNVGNSAYAYHKNLLNTFNPSGVFDTKGFWDWAREKLATNLRATVWYNGKQPYGLAGFINDKTSRMVGYAVLRQLRVNKDSCSVPNNLKNFTSFCNSDLNFLNQEKQNYGLNWMEYNESVLEEVGMSRIHNSFVYRNSDTLQGLPYWGTFNLYNGGGYVYELRGKLDFLLGNLTFLQKNNWIDRQTRAVFVEFSIYNPNINLFMVNTILFEFLPSGNILSSARFDPLNLFSEYDSYVGMRIAFGVIYLIFVLYFMVTQTISIYKLGFRKYFATFWNIIDWSIYVLAWASFSIYMYRFYSAQKVLDFFKNTSGYGYIKLQYVNEWNQVLTYLLGISCALSTIKFLKLFRFNRKIYSLVLTLKFSVQELFWFSIIFLVIFMAFVQVQYLILYERVFGYQSFIKAMATSFQIMLGKFSSSSLLEDGRFLAILFFSMYNIFIVIIMINMFISILNDGFDAVRKESKQKSNDLEMLEFFINKFKDMLGYNKKEKNDMDNMRCHNDYLDYTNTLTVKVNDLISKVIENANDTKVLETIPDEENEEEAKSADLNNKIEKKSKVESNISKRKEFHKKNTAFQ